MTHMPLQNWENVERIANSANLIKCLDGTWRVLVRQQHSILWNVLADHTHSIFMIHTIVTPYSIVSHNFNIYPFFPHLYSMKILYVTYLNLCMNMYGKEWTKIWKRRLNRTSLHWNKRLKMNKKNQHINTKKRLNLIAKQSCKVGMLEPHFFVCE